MKEEKPFHEVRWESCELCHLCGVSEGVLVAFYDGKPLHVVCDCIRDENGKKQMTVFVNAYGIVKLT